MILYNTLMGVAAGLALIMIPLLARKLYRRQRIAPEGWSLTFIVLGVILTFMGALMSVTWPLTVNQPINIAFGEPTLVLGLLLLVCAFFLWKRKDSLMLLSGGTKNADDAYAELQRVVTPVSWLVFALGLILLSCTLAIFRFTMVGSAPELEPISGLLHDYPLVENTFFGILYGLPAIGALLAPFAVRNMGGRAAKIAGISWVIAGVLFLLFSAMNYYTHIGLLVNIAQDKAFRF